MCGRICPQRISAPSGQPDRLFGGHESAPDPLPLGRPGRRIQESVAARGVSVAQNFQACTVEAAIVRHAPDRLPSGKRPLGLIKLAGHRSSTPCARCFNNGRMPWRGLVRRLGASMCYTINMINLSQETEALAARLAAAKRISAGEAIRQALEAELRALGAQARPRRRMTVEQMRALGAEIAALPLLDPRTPAEIMEDLNAL